MSAPAVTIAGAGIAGLTAALALARRGFSVTLLERRTGFSEVGAGLQLSPNASRLLIDLGLGPALRRIAGEPERVVIRSASSGSAIGTVALGPFMRERYGAPYLVAHRADLQTVLLDAVRGRSGSGNGGIRLMMGRTLVGLEEHSTGVAALVEGSGGRRETIAGAWFVGADGIWSAARTLLGDARRPRFRKHVAWRTTIPARDVPPALAGNETGLWLGRGLHAVHYPIAEGRLLNLVVIEARDKPVEGWSAPGEAEVIAARLKRSAPALRELAARAPEWLLWSLFDLDTGLMAKGRAALIGDAAHPVLPFLAQGAALAIEDAVTLAESLAHAAGSPDEVADPLAGFARMRAPRAARVQKEARRNGEIYHAGPLVALPRNVVIARLGPERMTQRYDWLYGWRASGD